VLDGWLGKDAARVILPITDPYVAPHGARSFATVHAGGPDVADPKKRIKALTHRCRTVERKPAALRAAGDRIGDIVLTDRTSRSAPRGQARLSGLDEPLRSHGGLTEQRVPMIANRRLKLQDGHRLRNFDVFDVAINRTI
jgi:phosphonoacetate hydrolase